VRSCPIAGASTASTVATHSTVSEAPSTPLPPFSPGTLVHELPLPSHPDAGPRWPPEHPPRRRTPSPSQFFHPSHRQEAQVSCRFHSLVRWLTPPPWMLERPTLPHLSHGSAGGGHTATRARRAVTAPVHAHAPHAGRGPAPPVGRGHHCAEATGWAARHYALAVGPSFGPLAFELFLYFLIIFKSLQIQKFV
jgi:hypothetical protein